MESLDNDPPEKAIVPPLHRGMTAAEFYEKVRDVIIPDYCGDSIFCKNINRYAQEFVFTDNRGEEYRITMLYTGISPFDPFVMSLRDRESRRFPRQDLSKLVLTRRQEDYELHVYPVLAHFDALEKSQYCREVRDCVGMEFG